MMVVTLLLLPPGVSPQLEGGGERAGDGDARQVIRVNKKFTDRLRLGDWQPGADVAARRVVPVSMSREGPEFDSKVAKKLHENARVSERLRTKLVQRHDEYSSEERRFGVYTLTNVALFKGAFHFFGLSSKEQADMQRRMYTYDVCRPSAQARNDLPFYSLVFHPDEMARKDCHTYEDINLYITDDLHGALARSLLHHQHHHRHADSSIFHSNVFQLHNDFLLPLYYVVGTTQKRLHKRPIVHVPMCGSEWFHLHREAHFYSHMQRASERADERVNALARNQLMRVMEGLRDLAVNGWPQYGVPGTDGDTARMASLQEAASGHVRCLGAVRWGVPPAPYRDVVNRTGVIDGNRWVRGFGRFIRRLYGIDERPGRRVSLDEVRRASWWQGARADPERKLYHDHEEPLDAALGLDRAALLGKGAPSGARVRGGATTAATSTHTALPTTAAAVRRNCVGCLHAIEGSDAWCRCCGLECGAYNRTECVESHGFCRHVCLHTVHCAGVQDQLRAGRRLLEWDSEEELWDAFGTSSSVDGNSVETTDDLKSPFVTVVGRQADDHRDILPTYRLRLLARIQARGFIAKMCCKRVFEHTQLVKLMYNTDILVGVHSGALVNLVYLRPGSLVVELLTHQGGGGDDTAPARLIKTMAHDFGLHYLALDIRDFKGSSGYALPQFKIDELVEAIAKRWTEIEEKRRFERRQRKLREELDEADRGG